MHGEAHAPPLAHDARNGHARKVAFAALLFLATLILYWRTTAFEFVNLDDDLYVTRNEHVRDGLSIEGLRWAFTTGHAANWHPLTWLSHQLDVELFGLDAGAHHRTNAVLHALDAALLFLALAALTRAPGRSALVAALFALHPLRVESVAWVAERKDLLAGGFAFATLLAYAGYAQKGGAARYALTLGLFALGLMAKPMGVTLPCVLLLLDAWPLARRAASEGRSWGALVREKLPFFALAALSSVVTLRVQAAGGAVAELDSLAPATRIANAFQATGLYVGKSFWPTELCVYHLHPAHAAPERSPWTPAVLGAAAFVLATSAALVVLRRRAPYALVGWLWFLGSLVPVIGLVQVGRQGWAERYSYFPTIGLALALVWGVAELARTRRVRSLALGAAAVALGLLWGASVRQLETWRSSRTLFARAVALDDGNFVAHNNLGEALEQSGEREEAERHYRRALELHPGIAGIHLNLARVLRAQSELGEARAELERALELEPELARAEAELGTLLAGLGEHAQALVHLRRARALLPDDAAVANVLAWVLATSPTAAVPEEALALCDVIQAGPLALPSTLETRAAALARLGRFAEAVEAQSLALERASLGASARARLELYRAGKPFLWTP